MRTEKLVLLLALFAVACDHPQAPFAYIPDSEWTDAYRGDTGFFISHDAGMDAVPPSIDANIDAPGTDMGMFDMGVPPAITIDGTMTESIWTANASNQPIDNANVATSEFDGDAMTRLYFARDSDWLYFGIEGTLISTDAIVFYVDTQGFGPGVTLSNMGLNDNGNHVSGVLSLPISGSIEFTPEWGWGTGSFSTAPTSYAAELGWRGLNTTGAFAPITHGGDVYNACNGVGCETAIRLAVLGASATSTVQFIVRLGRPGASGSFSTLTFPLSDTGSPETVGTPIVVAPPP